MKRLLRLVFVAIGFAGTGVLTERLFDNVLGWTSSLAVLPFGILAGILCVRPLPLIPVVAALHCGVWFLAFHLALSSSTHLALPLLSAGFIGGFGVAAATSIGCRRLFDLRILALTGLAGAAVAPLFVLYNRGGSYPLFAVWQATAGTVLYAFSRDQHHGDNL